GIEKSLAKIQTWFEQAGAATPLASRTAANFGALHVGMLSASPMGLTAAAVFANVARKIVLAGSSVLLPESDPLLASEPFRVGILGNVTPRATLLYGQPFTQAGLHIVATESDHWVENLAGLGGCGAH